MEPVSPRQSDIVMLARTQGRVSVDGLAERFDVTEQTIRKDLNSLCRRGILQRFHGGAAVVSGVANFDYEALTDDARISYDIWVYQYEAARAIRPFRRHKYIFTQMAGVHARLPSFLINQHRVEDASDMRAYIARISGKPTSCASRARV